MYCALRLLGGAVWFQTCYRGSTTRRLSVSTPIPMSSMTSSPSNCQRFATVSPASTYISVLILLYVSSYYYVCVLILLQTGLEESYEAAAGAGVGLL